MTVEKKTVMTFLLAGCLLQGASTLPAWAIPAQSADNANQLAAVVRRVTPAEVQHEDVRAAKAAGKGSGMFFASGEVDVSIPAAASGVVSATKTTAGGTVKIQVGTGSTGNTSGALAADGSVAYVEPGPVDHAVQATTDGFRIHTVISGNNAPTEFTHAVTLPKGGRLVAERDMPLPEGGNREDTGDAVFIVDAAGKVLGGFSAPWAKDANGTALKTHYEVRSTSMVQIVDHRTAKVAYPVVADPYLGFDMIQSASWTYNSGYGFTLAVTPTGWSRSLAGGYLPGVYGWNELYAKYSSRGLNTNLDGMRDQYICHQQVVAVRDPLKSTWNLDEWRPDVSYLQTINARCNPGGSVWFD
jgi:hypothetical protein